MKRLFLTLLALIAACSALPAQSTQPCVVSQYNQKSAISGAEWPDNAFSVREAQIPAKPEFKVEAKPGLLEGITELVTTTADGPLTLIPYYAWAHRGRGEMNVWFKKD